MSENQIIRVHTAEGKVYARIMEPVEMPWGLSYTFIETIEVPAGLNQPEAVDYFRSEGWRVEQDMGSDFDNPLWVGEEEDTHTPVWGDETPRECSLCGRGFIGMGNNPEPLKPFDERCCGDCNATKVLPARLGRMRGSYGTGKAKMN